ncbi:class I SAM-dependent methyltransferase [Oscillatoria sp. FACHB-1406]|uniref:class I SAM-dependent methyltransferase n=1 Tax=Oscillatoria sp. FACHB-1406 TaxID=2692846 RepID=UPI0016845C53|nr:class I SAM-dependent methyltransferase [Oscillatoria sp. FACHB-1406]MBD2577484.1 class I SAM-dependent methyltransferase [Oscillatoria sp. FACHB-1406]
MSQSDRYTIWANQEVSRAFLDGVRGAIPLATEQLDILLRVIRATQERVDSFLDLGCGNGILGWTIYREYPTAKGYFLDLSETMIEAAKEKLKGQENARFILKDFGLSSWVESVAEYAPFDVIVSGFSIHHQPDDRKQAIYREIYDLLKPGGLFLNLEHIASRADWGKRAFDDLFVDALYAFHRERGSEKSRQEIDREYYSRGDKDANILAPLELQCDWLREIGFVEVDCFMKLFEIALFGGLRSRPNNITCSQ